MRMLLMYSNESFNLRHALYIFFISCSNEFLHLNSSNCDNNYEGGYGDVEKNAEGFHIHHNVYSTVCDVEFSPFPVEDNAVACFSLFQGLLGTSDL
jgi:hypothetical protein